MYCKKCEKTLPSDSTFCPYCGNEKLEANEPKAEEAVEAVAAEEAVEAVAEEVTEETAETAAKAKKDGGKAAQGKGVIIGLLVVIIAILAVSVAMLAVKLFGGDGTPAGTEGPAVTENGETADDTELFPMEYTLVYPEGIDYSELSIDEYIRLGEYKNLTLTLTTSSEITDEEVSAYIEEQLSAYSTMEEVTDRAAKEGDSVNIDYAGTVDGVAFEGGTAEGASVVIGAGGYIDGFEDGIIGMNIGETKVIDVTFPENYTAELAGKEAQFAITLNSIEEEVLPEYNDAFVRDNFDMDTIPQFEAYVRQLLAEEREAEILAEKQAGLLTLVVDNSAVIKYPEGIVEDYMYQQIDSARYYGAMYYGMEYSEFIPAALGISAAEYEAEVRASSEEAVKQELVLFAVSEAEGLEITEQERQNTVDAYLEQYGAEDVAGLCQTLGISENYFDNTVTFAVTFEKVMNLLIENATFTGAK